MTASPLYITDHQGLRSFVARLRDYERIALDTEFVGEDSFVPRLELIQVAAGCLKQAEGRAEGARTLFTRALERLEPLPSTCEGVDLGVLVSQVRQWRDTGAQQRGSEPVVSISTR